MQGCKVIIQVNFYLPRWHHNTSFSTVSRSTNKSSASGLGAMSERLSDLKAKSSEVRLSMNDLRANKSSEVSDSES